MTLIIALKFSERFLDTKYKKVDKILANYDFLINYNCN